MRHKPLPPPPDELATVREAQAAVPLVPGSEADCCARLQGRLDLPGRDIAATWLSFLRAVGLADEGSSGFTRVRADFDDSALVATFLANVYGAREALDELAGADRPLDPGTVADRTQEFATAWERHKHGNDWPAVWRDRTADLLDWLVLLGLAERVDGGYRPADSD